MTEQLAGHIFQVWISYWFLAGVLFGLGLAVAYLIADNVRFLWRIFSDWLEGRP